MAQQTSSSNPSGNPPTLTGKQETDLSQDFSQKTQVGGVRTTYDPKVHPPMFGSSATGQRKSRSGRPSPFDRPSVFSLQTAYQKHHSSLQQRAQQQQQTGTGATPVAQQQRADAQVAQSEEEYKLAKEEEKAELAKFESVRNFVNELITSQEWHKMESSHVFALGSKLREAERQFWELKPAAERLVMKGRNKLAERVDLAEEELLHAIVVVSDIYRTRVQATAHQKYPGKIHPKYIAEQHEQQHAQQFRSAHPHHQPYGHPGHGHPGHFGYAGHEDFGMHPYHGHPYHGYGGYY